MIKKKIVMLGAFAVGKTSLVRQFVESVFSEKYHTTIGVKVDKKKVVVNGKEVIMLLWDIHGEDEFQKVKSSYITGSSGYFLVGDGTRSHTLDTVDYLRELARSIVGEAPFSLLINKHDLTEEWEVPEEKIAEFESRGWDVRKTSAKTGEHVDEAFYDLALKMTEKSK